MDITKLIPFNIRIKTLYWVKKEREIDSDLSILFEKIDNDEYIDERKLLETFRNKWTEISWKAPEWFRLEYMSQFERAEATLNFLETPLED
jgi:hypothetical protein